MTISEDLKIEIYSKVEKLKEKGRKPKEIQTHILDSYEAVTLEEYSDLLKEKKAKKNKEYVINWPAMAEDSNGNFKPIFDHPDNFYAFLSVSGYKCGKMVGIQTLYTDLNNPNTYKRYDQNIRDTLYVDIKRNGECDFKETSISAYLGHAFSSGVDLLKHWATSKPWDGVDRIKILYKLLNSANPTPFEELLFKKFVHGIVVQALDLRHSKDTLRIGENPMILILSGTAHGSGKTQFCRNLCPIFGGTEEVQDVLFTEAAIENNKDATIRKSEVLLWVVSEVEASLNNSSVGELKDILTTQITSVRKPFNRVNETLRRCCSFIGSTNETYILPPDESSYRRFIVITVGESLDYITRVDLQQLWAQVIKEREEGFENWLNTEEIKLNDERNVPYIKASSTKMFFEKCLVKIDEPFLDKNDIFAAYSTFCIENRYLDPKRLPALENSLIAAGFKKSYKNKKLLYCCRFKTSRENKDEME